MSFIDQPLFDATSASWTDFNLRLSPLAGGGLIALGGVKEFALKRTVEVGEQREGGVIIATTHGQTNYEASATLYLSGYRAAMTALIAAAPTRGGQKLSSLVRFSLDVQFTPHGDLNIYAWRLKGCRMLEDGFTGAEGTDAQTVPVVFKPTQIAYIDENGIESIPA